MTEKQVRAKFKGLISTVQYYKVADKFSKKQALAFLKQVAVRNGYYRANAEKFKQDAKAPKYMIIESLVKEIIEPLLPASR